MAERTGNANRVQVVAVEEAFDTDDRVQFQQRDRGCGIVQVHPALSQAIDERLR